MSLFTKFAGVAMAGMVLIGVGCASSDPGRDRSTKASNSIKDVSGEIADASKQLSEAMTAVAAVQTAKGDLAKPFDKAKSEVNDVEKAATKVTERVADMKAHAAEYQAKWAEQTATLSSEDLKAAAAKRVAAVKERFDGLQEKTAAAKAAYPVYMTETKELLNYLSHDLTPAGIQSAGAAFKRSQDKGVELQSKLAAVSAELDSISASLAPKN